jgi:hypothetical protein
MDLKWDIDMVGTVTGLRARVATDEHMPADWKEGIISFLLNFEAPSHKLVHLETRGDFQPGAGKNEYAHGGATVTITLDDRRDWGV